MTLPLTPDFSQVMDIKLRQNRFNGFIRVRKPFQRF
jgi:hypothetical protein